MRRARRIRMALARGCALAGLVLVVRAGRQPARSWTACVPSTPGVLLLGAALRPVTTSRRAWRWRLVARELGVAITLPHGVAPTTAPSSSTRSCRAACWATCTAACEHGRRRGRPGRGLRAVGWERLAGQVVQAVVALVVLVAAAVTGATGAAVAARCGSRWSCSSSWRCAVRPRGDAVEPGARGARRRALALLVRRSGRASCWPRWSRRRATSRLPGRGARRRGRRAPRHAAPLALVVLVAAGDAAQRRRLGPREGVAAWAFGAAGLGAAQGLATAVAYGVMVLVANLPGAGRARRGAAAPTPSRAPAPPQEDAPMADGPTRCSAAACRSTATSAVPPRSGWCCPTTPTSTGSTRCAPRATRSWSARRRSATTTRGCWSAPRPPGAATARGLPESPVKVTMTRQAGWTRQHFFATGDSEKLVYCPRRRSARPATARHGRDRRRRRRAVRMGRLTEDLHERGVRRLMVEGGGRCTRSSWPDGLPTSSSWSSRRSSSATRGPGGSSATARSRGTPDTGRPSSRRARSATSC